MSFRGFCWVLLGLLPVFLLLAAVAPPFDDELYYWCWSRELQLSYYDHPPMVAYLVRASTELFGNSILAIRLPGVLSGLVVVAVIGWLTRPRGLVWLVLLSPAVTFAAVLVTPDTPLLMFWALYLAWLVKVHERLAGGERPGFGLWLLGGLILGCGVLGKYTMGLAAVCGGVSFLRAGDWRRWAAGYALHAAVAFLVASPILIHNLRYDFVPIRYQWGHAMGSPRPGFAPFAEFVGVQLLLFGAAPFAVFAWAVRHRDELLTDPRLRVCWCLFVLPFAFFLLKATRGRLEGNWAFPCFLACWPLAAEWYSRVKDSPGWRWAVRAAFAVPAGMSLFLAVHAIYPVPFLPGKADRAGRQWEKMALARQVAADLRVLGHDGPVYASTYQWVAILRWHGIDARQAGGPRPSHFTERPDPQPPGRKVVFADAPDPARAMLLGPGVGNVVRSYPFFVRGAPIAAFWLLDSSDPAPAAEPAGCEPGRLDPAAPGPAP